MNFWQNAIIGQFEIPKPPDPESRKLYVSLSCDGLQAQAWQADLELWVGTASVGGLKLLSPGARPHHTHQHLLSHVYHMRSLQSCREVSSQLHQYTVYITNCKVEIYHTASQAQICPLAAILLFINLVHYCSDFSCSYLVAFPCTADWVSSL